MRIVLFGPPWDAGKHIVEMRIEGFEEKDGDPLKELIDCTSLVRSNSLLFFNIIFFFVLVGVF